MEAEENAAVAAGLLASAGAGAVVAEAAALRREADLAASEFALEAFAKPPPKPSTEAEREPYYASRLQSAWRRHRARRRTQAIRSKRAELEDACARLLQSRWRIRQARARVSGMKSQRAEQREQQMARSACVLQRCIRRSMARYRTTLRTNSASDSPTQ